MPAPAEGSQVSAGEVYACRTSLLAADQHSTVMPLEHAVQQKSTPQLRSLGTRPATAKEALTADLTTAESGNACAAGEGALRVPEDAGLGATLSEQACATLIVRSVNIARTTPTLASEPSMQSARDETAFLFAQVLINRIFQFGGEGADMNIEICPSLFKIDHRGDQSAVRQLVCFQEACGDIQR